MEQIILKDKDTASQLLTRALKGGVKLKRLQVTRKGRSMEKFKIVSKEMMKAVMVKWRNSPNSLEIRDAPGKTVKSRVKNTPRKVKPQVFTPRKVRTPGTYKQDSDSDIAILDESLSSKTKKILERKRLYTEEYRRRLKVPYETCRSSLSLQVPLPPSPESEEDDRALTCSVCYRSFWYEHETVQHVKTEHQINGNTAEKDVAETVQNDVSAEGELGDDDAEVDKYKTVNEGADDDNVEEDEWLKIDSIVDTDVCVDGSTVKKDVIENGETHS